MGGTKVLHPHGWRVQLAFQGCPKPALIHLSRDRGMSHWYIEGQPCKNVAARAEISRTVALCQ